MRSILFVLVVAPAVVVSACSRMSVEQWSTSCVPSSEGVEARNVGVFDNPEPALHKAALDMCRTELGDKGPTTYSILWRQTLDRDDGKVVQWGIRCGKPPPVVVKSTNEPEMC